MLEYWFMFPIAVIFSTIAMSVGIGGAAMFTPFFYLVLRIPASIAVGVGLVIEVFCFGSGLAGFAKKKLIDYRLAGFMLLFSIPAALAGVWLGKRVSDNYVMTILAATLLYLSLLMLKPDTTTTLKHHSHHDEDSVHWKHKRDETVGLLTALGGMLSGMVSTGLGEFNDYSLLKKCRMHGAIAAGTSVLVVAVTVLVASIAHMSSFTEIPKRMVLGVLVFSIPGVLIGSQLGVRISQKFTDAQRANTIGLVFIVLSILTVLTILLR